jgi:hypothetical protein
MRNSHHDRYALINGPDGLADEHLALLETEIGVFLGLHPGRDDHGGPTIGDNVVDLPLQRRQVNVEVGSKGR